MSSKFAENETATSPSPQRTVETPQPIDASLMAFVCFTDDFFNELFRPLHDNGPFSFSLPQLSFPKSAALKAFGLSSSTLEVELRKPIAVSIHETGLQILIDARTRPPGKQRGLIAMCEMSMKVDIKENHLVLLHGNAKCKIRVSKFWGKLIRGYARKKMEELIESKLKELVNKMVIPREATVVVDVETTIVYYEGSLVVRGKLNLVPEVIQQTLRRATRRKY